MPIETAMRETPATEFASDPVAASADEAEFERVADAASTDAGFEAVVVPPDEVDVATAVVVDAVAGEIVVDDEPVATVVTEVDVVAVVMVELVMVELVMVEVVMVVEVFEQSSG